MKADRGNTCIGWICTFDDTKMELNIQTENVTRKVFGYRANADLFFEKQKVRISNNFQNGFPYVLFLQYYSYKSAMAYR